MQALVLRTALDHESVVNRAAKHGDIDFFRAVVTFLKKHLTKEQVRVGVGINHCVGFDFLQAT